MKPCPIEQRVDELLMKMFKAVRRRISGKEVVVILPAKEFEKLLHSWKRRNPHNLAKLRKRAEEEKWRPLEK